MKASAGDNRVIIANNGAMSKSIKAKSTVTVSGGDITLQPSGTMQVINSDASYSSGIKAADYVQTGGNINITATYHWGRNLHWEGSFRWNYGSGFPFTLTQALYPNITNKIGRASCRERV